MPIAEIVLPELHTGQLRIVRERRRFNVPCLGRRVGKSTLCLSLLLDDPGWDALDGYPCAWFAGTSKIFDEVWRLTLATIPPAVIARTDTQKHRIELVTGGLIDFWSLDGGDRGGAGRGRKYRRAVVDEAALVPGLMEVWSKAIRPTLIDLQGDAYFPSTPRGLQNDYYDMWKRGDPKSPTRDEKWAAWQMPSMANPHLSAAELDDLKKEYTGRPLDYRQEILAEFVGDAGQVFQLSWINDQEKPPKQFSHLYASWDIAVTDNDLERGDYTVGVVVGQDAIGRYWLLDVIRGRWNSLEAVERMLQTARKYNTARCWYEGGPVGRAVEPILRKRMRERDDPAFYFEMVPHSGRGDKVVRTGPLVAIMANGSFYVPAGAAWLHDLRDELAAFSSDPKSYRHDDQVDALSQLFLQLQAIRQSAPVPITGRILDPTKVTGDVLATFNKNLADESGEKPRKRTW